jgi:hypothetical protein
MTRPSSEPYYRRRRPLLSNYSGKADLYITTDERAQDLIGGAKPATAAPRRDANQQPDKSWDKRPREEVHAIEPPSSRARGGPRRGEHTLDDILDAQCPYHKDMRHTLRNCKDFKHSVGNDRPFQALLPPPPRHEEDLENLDNPSSRRREEVEPSHALTKKSTSSSVDTGRKKARDNKSSTIVRYWWRLPVLPPRTDGPSTRSPSPGQISGSTSTIQASTRSS